MISALYYSRVSKSEYCIQNNASPFNEIWHWEEQKLSAVMNSTGLTFCSDSRHDGEATN